jgi:hypothetical protein
MPTPDATIQDIMTTVLAMLAAVAQDAASEAPDLLPGIIRAGDAVLALAGTMPEGTVTFTGPDAPAPAPAPAGSTYNLHGYL